MPREIPYIDTTVPVVKTISEIDDLLQLHGADSITKEFDGGKIKAIVFRHNNIPFELPARVESVYQHLVTLKRPSPRYRDEVPHATSVLWHEQAERCAWRNILYWVKAQLALVELDMVTVTEIFLPYMLTGTDETLYQRMLTQGLKALPEPSEGDKK